VRNAQRLIANGQHAIRSERKMAHMVGGVQRVSISGSPRKPIGRPRPVVSVDIGVDTLTGRLGYVGKPANIQRGAKKMLVPRLCGDR